MLNILAADFGDYGPSLINDVVDKYVQAINSGFGLIRGNVSFVLNVLVVISIFWSALVWAFSEDHLIAQFCRKVIFIGIFVWLIQNWQVLTDKVGQTFMDLGLRAGGFDSTSTYTSQPGDILYLCYNTIDPIIQQISRLCSGWTFYKNLGQIIMLAASVMAIVAAFFVITVQVALAVLTFKFGSLATFVLLPFGIHDKTSFMAERPLGWVVGSGIRLMVLTLVLGIANGIFGHLAPASGSTVTIYEALTIALASLLLVMFSLVASRLATDLIIGGPSLGAGTAMNQTAVAYNTATTTVTRPSYLAAKAAAAVATKGVSAAADTGRAILNTSTSGFIRAPGGQPVALFSTQSSGSRNQLRRSVGSTA